jgi:hypothetical protein
MGALLIGHPFFLDSDLQDDQTKTRTVKNSIQNLVNLTGIEGSNLFLSAHKKALKSTI